MNRNTETIFKGAELEGIKRSQFKLDHNHKTTFNAGEIIPFYLEQDVLPADTHSVKLSMVIRMLTPIYPTMDNIYADTYFFYVPNRICWEHWKDMNGENRHGAWTQETEYTTPQITAPTSTGWTKGTIADYMGIPTGKKNFSVSALPFRGYIKIYNEFMRNQNIVAPLLEMFNDTTVEGDNTSAVYGGKPCKAMKFRDYFTSCLPEPQKGESITLPLGSTATVKVDYTTGNNGRITYTNGSKPPTDITPFVQGTTGNWTFSGGSFPKAVYDPNNTLYADLANATAASVNTLREAFAMQRVLERDARNGTRYTEIIRSYFGVSSPDERQQRPEYLGGSRLPINITQVLQTSASDETSPQGNTSAYSLTVDSNEIFTKSFTEHGMIIGLLVVRQDHTYQQGLERGWTRKRRLDYYIPTLAHLGEQAVKNKEIFLQGNSTDEETFGFQERWAEYKYKPNRTSGAMRSTYPQAIDQWHYGDEYISLPVLSKEFLEETDLFVARTLAITNEDQFLADILIENTATRAMPTYCTPGMLDHF